MPKALRISITSFLLLTLLLASGPIELCHHEQDLPIAQAGEVEVLLSGASCEGCCDTGHEDEHTGACHSCACFCHSIAILAAHAVSALDGPAERLHLALALQNLSDFQAGFDRPPLRS